MTPACCVAAIGNLAGQAVLAALMMRRAAGILSGAAPPPARTGADATETVRALLRLRPRGRITEASLFDDLSFVFVWTAAVMQLLLLFDPRYRDFPLPVFAVPLVCVIARALLADLPRDGGGREELWAGGTLAVAAVASAGDRGAGQSPGARLEHRGPGARDAAPAQGLAARPRAGRRVIHAQAPSASPSIPQVAL